MLRVVAPAKVNLGLRILAREASGFHQLETVFLALEMGDTLLVEVGGDGISLSVDGPLTGPLGQNLVYRAARAFMGRAGGKEGLKIRLSKRIPVQGGLGGGSSDAAATLKALSALFPGAVGASDLWQMAADLGSDVPFFLSHYPMALAWGRGERLLPLLPLPRAWVVLALPPLSVSTPEAFAALAQERSRRADASRAGSLSLEDLGSWAGLASMAENDFEAVVFQRFPLLGRIRAVMEETSPTLSLLSGTGASLFAVFLDKGAAEAGLEGLQASFPETRFLLTRTLEKWPGPVIFQNGVEGTP